MTTTFFSIFAIIFSGISLLLSLVAISMVAGFLRSTHTVQWKTLDPSDYMKDSPEIPGDVMTSKKKPTREDFIDSEFEQEIVF